MEESYQAAVRRERTQSIQALNFELKYMIVGHITAFQGRNLWGTAVLWVVYKYLLQSKGRAPSFVSHFSCIACCSYWLMVYFSVLWSCFWERWWHLILPGILSICLNLIRNRFKLRLCSWDHFKKRWAWLFFEAFSDFSLGAWWLVVLWYYLLLPNHSQV